MAISFKLYAWFYMKKVLHQATLNAVEDIRLSFISVSYDYFLNI